MHRPKSTALWRAKAPFPTQYLNRGLAYSSSSSSSVNLLDFKPQRLRYRLELPIVQWAVRGTCRRHTADATASLLQPLRLSTRILCRYQVRLGIRMCANDSKTLFITLELGIPTRNPYR